MADSDSDGRRRWRLVRAGTDAVPASLRRLMSRARTSPGGRPSPPTHQGGAPSPRARRPQLVAVPWTLVAATAAAVGLLGWIVFISPVFGVRKVDITGLVMLGEDQVLQAAGIPLGTPLVRVDVDAVHDQVAALAPAASVEVSRGWPSTLHIAVVERAALAAVKRDNLFHVFDGDGVIFMTAESLPADVVEVRLPDAGSNGAGDKPMKAALRVVKALTPELRSELVRIEVAGPAGILLVLRKDRMVTWGDAEQSDLKAKVATALLAQKGKQIDVSVPEIVTIQ